MNTNLANALKRIVTEKGEAILNDTKQVNSLLADYASTEPKPEKKALITCLMDSYHVELKKSTDADRLNYKTRLAQKLHGDEGLELSICENTLDILEFVLLGKVTPRPLTTPQPAYKPPPAPAPVRPVPQPAYQPPAPQPVYQPPVPQPIPVTPTQYFSRYCPHCGAGLVDGAVLCVKCGSNVAEPKDRDTGAKGKTRHGFTTFYLWISLIGNGVSCFFSFRFADAGYEILQYIPGINSDALAFFGILCAAYMTSCILLLCWKKIGFWILFLGLLFLIIDPLGVFPYLPLGYRIVSSIISILILFGVLHLRCKNGLNAWEQLD
jgi:hypothetical protein